MPQETVYLTLPDNVGVASEYVRNASGLDVPNPKAAEPEPINSIGLSIPIPTMAGGEIVNVARRVEIRPAAKLGEGDVSEDGVLQGARIVPGTRIVECAVAPVTSVLVESGYVQCDPPKNTTAPATGGKE